MAKWGPRRSNQYRKTNRAYQRRWRKRMPEAARSISRRHYYKNRKKLLACARERQKIG